MHDGLRVESSPHVSGELIFVHVESGKSLISGSEGSVVVHLNLIVLDDLMEDRDLEVLGNTGGLY